MTESAVARYLGGRKYSLCVLVALCAFAALLLDRLTGAQACSVWAGCIGANSGGNLLQRWMEKASS